MTPGTQKSADTAPNASGRPPSGAVAVAGTAVVALAGCLLIAMAMIRPGW